jgi:hypothetical protein
MVARTVTAHQIGVQEGPMADSDLYETDILVWSEQQAAALRSLASRRDLPNELDLANVIEEIEDVGKSEFHSVESLVENILTHLVLLAADPEAPATRGWIAEITAWNLALRRRISPSMRGRLDMQALWSGAVEVASAKLAVWNEAAAAAAASLTGVACPFTPDYFPVDKLDTLTAASLVSERLAEITPR